MPPLIPTGPDTSSQQGSDGRLKTGIVAAVGTVIVATVDKLTLRTGQALLGFVEKYLFLTNHRSIIAHSLANLCGNRLSGRLLASFLPISYPGDVSALVYSFPMFSVTEERLVLANQPQKLLRAYHVPAAKVADMILEAMVQIKHLDKELFGEARPVSPRRLFFAARRRLCGADLLSLCESQTGEEQVCGGSVRCGSSCGERLSTHFADVTARSGDFRIINSSLTAERLTFLGVGASICRVS
jgi:hypothetical protein